MEALILKFRVEILQLLVVSYLSQLALAYVECGGGYGGLML